MNYQYCRLIVLLALLSSPLTSQTDSPSLSRWQAHRLISNAHSEQEYNQLCLYYHARAQMHRQQAYQQEQILLQEKWHPTAGKSYPSVVVTAERLHSYYINLAKQDELNEASARKRVEASGLHGEKRSVVDTAGQE